jgi:phosphatidylglycerol:prolipoprotein diacylglycerol transferase
MNLEIWNNLPSYVSPSFSLLGFFNIHFYSLAYILGFLAVVILSKKYIKDNKLEVGLSNKEYEDVLLNAFIMAVIGGRTFYVLFYNLDYFLANPLQIIWPFNALGEFTGLSGMSFHGGLFFTFVYLLYIVKKKRINITAFQEAFVPYIPIAFFLGRIANFMNGELYGRPTQSVIGMYFDGILRHPSQLYEAFLEGIVLFLILLFIRKSEFKNYLGVFLVAFYVLFRFIVEFFREPDVQLGLFYGFSMGQILSVLCISLIGFFVYTKKAIDKN